MCMQQRMGPHGLPLEDCDLGAMPEEERLAFVGFFSQATQEIEIAGEDAPQPLTPSAALRAKYEVIVGKYDGGKYCPVAQLQMIFGFTHAVQPAN